MRFRRATWGRQGDVWDWRGYAWSLLTKRRIYSFEFQVQHQPQEESMTDSETLERVGFLPKSESPVKGCRGRGICGCSSATEPIINRDPGDENTTVDPSGGAVVNDNWNFWPSAESIKAFFEPKADRHPSSQAFVDRVTGWVALHDKKQADYGSATDPFANIREGACQLGLPAWVGAVMRMNDKMRRLNNAAKQYIETGQINLANEGVLDSFDDLGVYSGIGAVVFEEERNDFDSFA